MKNKIYITNEQKALKIDKTIKDVIRKVINASLVNEKFEYPAEVSVLFVDDDTIHQMNLEHRNKDKSTDVLSFPLLENAEVDEFDINDGVVAIGDIVISCETAMRQANEYGHSVEREIGFLCVHSMLHLLGYDHEVSKDDEVYMNDTCEKILSSLELYRNTK